MRKIFGITILLLTGFLLCIFLHNIFYALFGFEEIVFFILGLICFAGFIIMIGYTAGIKIKKRLIKKKKTTS